MTARFIAGAVLGLTLSTAALAQSYTAPAGIPAVTAPGGTQGRAALPNLLEDRERPVRVGTPYGTADDLTTGSLRRSFESRTGYGR